MILYLALFVLILSVLVYDVFPNEYHKYQQVSLYAVNVFLLIAVAAFRYRVGTDSLRYEDGYNIFSDIFHLTISDFERIPFEPLWILFCSVLHSFSREFLLLQIVHAIFFNIVVGYFFYKFSKAPFITLLLYFFSVYFLFNTESIRESLAIAVFLLFYPPINKSKIIYFLGCFICVFIHFGAFILFFIPFLKNIKLTTKKLLLFVSATVLLSGIVFTILQGVQLSMFGSLVEYKFRTYVGRTGVINPYTIFVNLIIPFFVLLFISKQKKEIRPFDGMALFYFLIIVGAFFVPALARLSNYFILFYLIYLSNFISSLIKRCTNNLSKPIWAYIIIFVFSLQFTLWFFVRIQGTSYRNYHKYLPYSTIFDKQKSQARENIDVIEFE